MAYEGRRYHQIRLQAPQWTSGLEAQQESAKEKESKVVKKKSVPLQSIKPGQYNLKIFFQIQGHCDIHIMTFMVLR